MKKLLTLLFLMLFGFHSHSQTCDSLETELNSLIKLEKFKESMHMLDSLVKKKCPKKDFQAKKVEIVKGLQRIKSDSVDNELIRIYIKYGDFDNALTKLKALLTSKDPLMATKVNYLKILDSVEGLARKRSLYYDSITLSRASEYLRGYSYDESLTLYKEVNTEPSKMVAAREIQNTEKIKQSYMGIIKKWFRENWFYLLTVAVVFLFLYYFGRIRNSRKVKIVGNSTSFSDYNGRFELLFNTMNFLYEKYNRSMYVSSILDSNRTLNLRAWNEEGANELLIPLQDIKYGKWLMPLLSLISKPKYSLTYSMEKVERNGGNYVFFNAIFEKKGRFLFTYHEEVAYTQWYNQEREFMYNLVHNINMKSGK